MIAALTILGALTILSVTVLLVVGRLGVGLRRDGIFRLITEPDDGVFCPYCHRPADVRRYPELDPPATFRDCWSCGLTWEVGP